jgi:hypothetical protein
MTLADALRLGRVSNLPTVWTNGLAGATLAGGAAVPPAGPLLVLLAVLSLFYVGGMYLNDAFDRRIDARERPQRPIPSGRVAAGTVFVAGFGQLAAALTLLAVLDSTLTPAGGGAGAITAGGTLAAAIVVYDAWHKGNPFGPLIMGLCRALVYVTAALVMAGRLPAGVSIAALMLLCHVAGLSYAAKQEALGRLRSAWPLAVLAAPVLWTAPVAAGSTVGAALFAAYALTLGGAVALLLRRRAGDIGRAAGVLIAAICLFDGLVIAGAGSAALAVVAAAGCPLTLLLQRQIPGT